MADGGTLFFDDVDTLPLGVQAKLLRALQEGEVQRVGSNALRQVDVRIVAATNKDLLAEVRAGRFREDLYYRLHVVPIRLPPLRERREDVPLLVQHFIEREGPRLGRSIPAVAAETMEELQNYSWPGNIRELRNVIERALVMANDDVLQLPGPLRGDAALTGAALAQGEVGSLLSRRVGAAQEDRVDPRGAGTEWRQPAPGRRAARPAPTESHADDSRAGDSRGRRGRWRESPWSRDGRPAAAVIHTATPGSPRAGLMPRNPRGSSLPMRTGGLSLFIHIFVATTIGARYKVRTSPATGDHPEVSRWTTASRYRSSSSAAAGPD